MSLFSYTERPFQAESSSEEGSDSEEEGSKGNLFQQQARLNNKKRPISRYKNSALKKPNIENNGKAKTEVFTLDDDNVDDCTKKIVSLDSSDDEENCSDIEEKYRQVDGVQSANANAITMKAKQLATNLIAEKKRDVDKIVDKIAVPVCIDVSKTQSEVKKFENLLKRIRSPTKTASSMSKDQLTASELARSKMKAASHSSLQNLPQVRTQLERSTPASVSSIAKSITRGDVVHSSGNGEKEIVFYTILNCKHKWRWQVGVGNRFAEMKTKFRSLYGLDKFVKVTMKDPNGEVVQDNDTPEKLEMEQDDQIDVMILPQLYTKAVECAEASKKSSSVMNGGAATSDSNMIRFVTRLNGKHTWKWQISPCDSFAKMKAKFRSIYGLNDMVKVTMKDPTGDIVRNDSTPEGLEMEQDDQFDVTIPGDLYSKAVACAEDSKSQNKPKAQTSTAQVNYVSSVSSYLAEQAETDVKGSPSEDKVVCNVVVPSELCKSGRSTIIPFKVTRKTTLDFIHSNLMNVPSLRFMESNSSWNGGYWYSLESADEKWINITAAVDDLLDDANVLELALHKISPVASTNDVINLHVFDCTENCLESSVEVAVIKVKPKNNCTRLMAMLAENCIQISLSKLAIYAHVDGKVELKPDARFDELGINCDAALYVETRP